jgi:DNA-binding CsgD family transcriptional regulator
MLDLLGLDSVAESVYRAMLASPEGGVAEIAERTALSEDEVRKALDRLSELALLRPSYDVPGEMRAIRPEVGMEMLLARQQAELAAHQQRFEQSRAAAVRLIAETAELRQVKGSAGAEHLLGLDQIRSRLAELTRTVESEVMAFAPGGAQSKENREAARPLDEQLLRRGVRMRTVYLDSVRNHAPSVAYADWLAKQGGEVRTGPSLPVRMVIVDRRTAVVSNEGGNGEPSATVLHMYGAVTALCSLFDIVWAGATPLGSTARRDERGITPQQGEVLRLLAQGLTDEATAHRLGVAPRTARRIAAELMERLGARSRFQAGAHAALRGWLDPPQPKPGPRPTARPAPRPTPTKMRPTG